MPLRTLLAISVLLLLATPAAGQVALDNQTIRDGIKQGTDATVVLSAGPEVGTGTFELHRSELFQEMDSSQIKLRIYVGPWVKLGEEPEPTPKPSWINEPEGDPEVVPPRLRGFIFLNYGTNESVGDAIGIAPTGPPLMGRGLSPFAKIIIDSTSWRAGGGIRLDPLPWLAFLPTFTVSYNDVNGRADGDLIDQQILERDFGKVLVDWRSESLTYIPQLEVRFTLDLPPIQLRATVYLSYLLTNVHSSTSNFQDFTSHSGLGVLLLEFDWNTGWRPIADMNVHVIPTFRYTRVEGDAVAGLGTNDIVSAEIGVLFDTTDTVPFASRLGVHARYIFGARLRAWSVGVAHEF